MLTLKFCHMKTEWPRYKIKSSVQGSLIFTSDMHIFLLRFAWVKGYWNFRCKLECIPSSIWAVCFSISIRFLVVWFSALSKLSDMTKRQIIQHLNMKTLIHMWNSNDHPSPVHGILIIRYHPMFLHLNLQNIIHISCILIGTRVVSRSWPKKLIHRDLQVVNMGRLLVGGCQVLMRKTGRGT